MTSRRGAAAKEPLSQAAIVKAAHELLRRDGLEGMSLRKVAAVLETGPASLYAYVESLEELEALVCDHALAAVKTKSAPQLGWRKRLSELLTAYLLVLMSTPGLARLAMKTIAVGPNALRILEALLGILEEGGVERGVAAWASDLLTLHVTAIAAEQSERQNRADPLLPAERAIATVSPELYPLISAARDDLFSGGGTERLAWALEVLISGILSTPRPVATRKARASKRKV